MYLPPELIAEIIDHIHPSDVWTLRNCSLVAKSWMYPSRRRLFDTVDVGLARTLIAWLKNISPMNAELLQHVRSLYCGITSSPNSVRNRTGRVDFLLDYTPFFCQLRLLSLTSGRLTSSDQIGTPSAFRHTLKDLRLARCYVAINALVTVINYFPNLVRLYLIKLEQVMDGQPVPPLSRPMRKLFILGFSSPQLSFLEELLKLRLQCDEVTLNTVSPSPSLAQLVVDGVEEAVKRLDLQGDLGRK
jgi:hypothetical protein